MKRWVVFGLRWKYLSLVFFSPLPPCVYLYLLPLLPSAGSWESSQSSRWPSPEPLSALEGRGLHTMHYLEVNGFVLAGPAAVNRHHYSCITEGTGWNETVFNACNYLKARMERGSNESWWEGRRMSFKVLNLESCRKGCQFFICEGIHRAEGKVNNKIFVFLQIVSYMWPSCSPQVPPEQVYMV